MMRSKANPSGPAPQECPLTTSLKLLAGAWTPQILWYLKVEPRRFGDLKRDLGKVSAKVLTTRLRELENRGVVTRTVKPTSPPTVEYALSDLGKRLNPILDSIAEVGKGLRKLETKPAGSKVPALAAGA